MHGPEPLDPPRLTPPSPPGGTEGGIAALESALRPVERYAVRFVELEQPTLDKDQLAAQVGASQAGG